MKKQTTPVTTINEYIAPFPKAVQTILRNTRNAIRKSAPGATETIKYGIPTFIHNNKNLVHFGAFEKHLGFYPAPSGVKRFAKELIPYKTAKGSIQFPFTTPIPYDLISKIVSFRVTESKGK